MGFGLFSFSNFTFDFNIMISKLPCRRKFSGEQIKTWNGVFSMSGNYRSDSLRCRPLEILAGTFADICFKNIKFPRGSSMDGLLF